MKNNYDLVMQEELKKIKESGKRPKLLLHSCCAPCSTTVIIELNPYFDLTVYFFNPNIEPIEEYEKRKSEQIRLLNELNINFLDSDYSNKEYHNLVDEFSDPEEGGKRCEQCIAYRLNKTANIAKEKKCDYFTTTLSVSPHKNSQMINNLGKNQEEMFNIPFLYADFKKREGYKKSVELAKEYNLYRQEYCGCLVNKKNADD